MELLNWNFWGQDALPIHFQGRRLTFTVEYSKIKQGVQLWLYFNVFRKSDLWQDINDAILLFNFAIARCCYAAAERKSIQGVLNTYTLIAQKVAIFAEEK